LQCQHFVLRSCCVLSTDPVDGSRLGPVLRGADSSETYRLAERSALADGNLVTLLNTESGGNVGGEVLVALLVTVVLGDEVEVLAADDDGSVHLGGNDGAGQDTATDGDLASEGALLVCKHKSINRCPPKSSCVRPSTAASQCC